MSPKTSACFSIESAKQLFLKLFHDFQIDGTPVIGSSPSAPLSEMLSEDRWLAVLMLASDEICIFAKGFRLWDAVYQADNTSQEGVRPIHPGEASSSPVIHTYSQYRVMGMDDEIELTALRLQIMRQAILEKLDISPKGIGIMPVNGIYDIQSPLEHGDILPLPSVNAIGWSRFKNVLSSAAATADFVTTFSSPGEHSHD